MLLLIGLALFLHPGCFCLVGVINTCMFVPSGMCCVCVHACIYACVYVRACVYMHACVCACACVCVNYGYYFVSL